MAYLVPPSSAGPPLSPVCGFFVGVGVGGPRVFMGGSGIAVDGSGIAVSGSGIAVGVAVGSSVTEPEDGMAIVASAGRGVSGCRVRDGCKVLVGDGVLVAGMIVDVAACELPLLC